MTDSSTAIGSVTPVFAGSGGSSNGATPAPADGPYVLAAADPSLPNGRTLAGEATVIDVTDGGAGNPITVGVFAGGITNAKLADMATGTFKGNISGGVAAPSDLTTSQVEGALCVFTTTDPTLTNDSANGSFAGQRWVNTTAGRSWICQSAAVGAAAWKRTGGPPAALGADAGTVALYTFNGNANDSGGGGYNLTVTGTINYCPGFGGRQVGRFTSNNNANAAIAALDLSGSMTMEALIFCRPNPNSATIHTFAQYGPNATRRYFLDFDNVSSAFLETGYWNGATDVVLSVGIQTETWQHVLVRRTVSGGNTTIELWVNGVLAASDTRAGGPTSGSSSLYVGRNATGATGQILFGEYIGGLHFSTSLPTDEEIRRRAQLYLPNPGWGV